MNVELQNTLVELLRAHFDQQAEMIRLLTLIMQDGPAHKNITKSLSENLYGQ